MDRWTDTTENIAFPCILYVVGQNTCNFELETMCRDEDPSRPYLIQFGSYRLYFLTLYHSDEEPPRVDSCISPPPYILKKGRRAAVTWDDPVFSDNSRGALNIHRTHADLKRFPVGTTMVKYTATDKYGNNATCTIKVVVKGIIILFAFLCIYIYNNLR